MVDISGSVSQPYEFVGREGYYREGELYLLGQRWYDSKVGRFISRDPIGEKGGVNLYVYANNSPVILIDPEGKKIICGGYDFSASGVVGVGEVVGFSFYWCYDTCKKCGFVIFTGYTCNCIGLNISMGFSLEMCVAENVKDITTGQYNLATGGAGMSCGSVSFNDQFTLKCGSFGRQWPPSIGYATCRCSVRGSYASNCCSR